MTETSGKDAPPSSLPTSGPGSLASAGVEIVESKRRRIAPLPSLEQAAHDALSPEKQGTSTPPTAPSRRLAGVAGVAGVAIVGASVVVAAALGGWLWHRAAYVPGSVLAHLPDACATLTVTDYAALEAAQTSRAIADKRAKQLLDWAEDEDRDEGLRHSIDEAAKGRSSAFRALERKGVNLRGDIREVAVCVLAADADSGDGGRDRDVHEKVETTDTSESDDRGTRNVVRVIGGALGGDRFLAAYRAGYARRFRLREDRLALDDLDGHAMLKLERGRVLVMATRSIALLGPKRVVAELLDAHKIDRALAMHEGDLFTLFNDEETAKLARVYDARYTLRGDRVTYTRLWRPRSDPTAKKAARESLKDVARTLRKRTDLDALADAFDDAEIELDGDEAKTVVTFASNDLTTATRALLDAKPEELRALRYELEKAPGGALLFMFLAPAYDGLDLRLMP